MAPLPALPPHWSALAVLTAARASLGFQFQSVPSASPALMEGFGIDFAALGMLIGLYFLPGIVLALPGGMLGRRFGDRRLVASGMVLMTLGGTLMAVAGNADVLSAGRLISGAGAVLLNVTMAKMVSDWFAGREEIVLAMAIFVNSFPIGSGLALLLLGPLSAAAGASAAMLASAAAALLALLLLLLAYRRHPNDGFGAAVATQGARITAGECVLVCVAGAIWGIYNGVFGIIFGFAPTLLADAGIGSATAGLVLGSTIWLMVGSIQVGGVLAQRSISQVRLLGWSMAVAATFMILLAWLPPVPLLIAIGLVLGLPVGVIMSLPATVLRPEARSLGMGVFYTGLYVGHAGLPPIAGWLRDASGDAGAPLLFAGVMTLVMPGLHAMFRALQRRAAPQTAVA
ncbi:MFS transporter [Neoroseomonas oryzicola]|uniref:MFS transporter n=1 Tax=Neoroseomonas oryzicola TaxID=535904 RepID=A0A9X9WD35_9PROT|nr:MFS transporter [Neoroseomonas oryzicola]NKE15938.1 MFS transporter [Neoroseomonas oryzicola]